MRLFLRFTETAETDLKRGHSFHHGIPAENKKEAAEIVGVDVSRIKKIKGMFCQELEGLCGFELESESLEEALEEIDGWDRYLDIDSNSHAIYEGILCNEDCPEGDCFIPRKILYKKKIKK